MKNQTVANCVTLWLVHLLPVFLVLFLALTFGCPGSKVSKSRKGPCVRVEIERLGKLEIEYTRYGGCVSGYCYWGNDSHSQNKTVSNVIIRKHAKCPTMLRSKP